MMSHLRMSSISGRSIEGGRDIEDVWRVIRMYVFVRDTFE